jgi:hypothetical protein
VEIAALVLAALAIVLLFVVEWVKRPRLEIAPSLFIAPGPIPWTFAAVQARNKPLGLPWRWLLSRESAQGCRVTIDILHWVGSARVMPSVRGRWSSHPEPLRSVRVEVPAGERVTAALAGITARYEAQYDPTLDPPEQTVAASEAGEEVAVAILRQTGGASAWGTESYAYPGWAKPEWQLDHGTYRVEVRVEGSSVSKTAAFKLEYLNEDFARFRLQPM